MAHLLFEGVMANGVIAATQSEFGVAH